MAIFRPGDEERIRERFAALDRAVELVVALGPEETPLPGHADVDFGAETVRIVEELCTLSDKVTRRIEREPPGLERFPAVLICPEGDDAGLRYDGLPWGHELGSLVGAVLEAGRAESSLRPESLEALAGLDRDLAIDVFVTPT